MNSYALSSLKRPTPAARLRFRPNLDTLEDRTCPATLPLVNLPIDVGTVTSVVNQGVTTLTAPVTIAGQAAGTLTMDATAAAATTQGGNPILDLHINPIHLNLLGLHVDTSAICLDVTANPGQGLLGDLLGQLSAGDTLSTILGKLGDVTSDLNTFLDQVGQLADGLLGQNMNLTQVLGTSAGATTVAAQTPTNGNVDILNLSLGPINLDLLGLHVGVDNCANGPVTVDVTADPNGGLLGSLLGGLADGNLTGQLISRVVSRLDTLIDRVTGIADQLGQITSLPGQLGQVANRLIDQLEKVADRVDSLADLDRLINRLDKITDRLDRLIENTDVPAPLVTRLETLLGQVTRIINRFHDLGLSGRLISGLERTIDRIFAQL